uniref:IMS import disulfide relay-system CHCH-CHCH-like Cx9C domain-containing protein n=1 Tax=Fibrocapsa japonica TaxID=94617 RepID=A0A7S2Y1Q9_9STRA
MDRVLADVEAACGNIIEKFKDCIESNGNTMAKECERLKKEVGQCAEERVAAVKISAVKCQPVIQVYQECISKNSSNMERCEQQLLAMANCIDTAISENEERGQKWTKRRAEVPVDKNS